MKESDRLEHRVRFISVIWERCKSMRMIFQFVTIFGFFIFSKGIFAMECTSDKTMTGEYWFYNQPSIHSFDYFEFQAGLGGMASSSARLKFALFTSDVEPLLTQILAIKKGYPFSYLSVRKGAPQAYEFSISGYMLYDFDMQFAKKIEKVFFEFERKKRIERVNETVTWGNTDYYRAEIKSKHVSFYGKGISWVHSSPDKKTGLETQSLRMDLHHKGQLDKVAFLKELKRLLIDSNVEYFDHREYDNNYRFFISNGRQGTESSQLRCSDFAYFKSHIFELLEKYELILGHSEDFYVRKSGVSGSHKLSNAMVYVGMDNRNK